MEHIVVGVDPSEAGARAMEWALREAVARKAPLKAVRAWQTPVLGMYYPVGGELATAGAEAMHEAQALADEQLKVARDRVPGAAAVDAQAFAVMGHPAQVLVDASRDASLVVVGSRGLGMLSRAVLGSVSSSVLHHAACPVAVVPATSTTDRGAGRALVGVDHSPESVHALRAAAAHAARQGETLVPVMVHELLVATEPGVDIARLEETERRRLHEAAAGAGATGVPVEPEVLTGHAAAGLRALARPEDTLFVGSRGRGGFTGLLLGSTSTQLAQHATCPVVVVRGS